MKSKSWAVLGLVLLCTEARAQLTTNRWITAGSGFWTNAASWSAGVAPTTSHAAINITNATTKTVTINAQTADANLTISNLFVSGPAGTVNTLQITNAPAKTLRVLNSLVVTNGGALVVTNSTVRVDTTCSISGVLSNRDGGLLVLTNASTVLRGAIFGVGGAMLASNVTLTGVGTFTHEGGTNTLSGALTVGSGANATGTVWVTGGRWVVTNALTLIGTTAGTGLSAAGQLTVSNGTMLAKDMSLCEFIPSRGTLTVAGGTLAMTGPLTVGVDPSLTGTVWVTGGQLVVTNTPASVSAGSGLIVDGSVSVNTGCSITVSNLPTVVGNTGSGSLTSFGSVLFHNLTVGNLSGSRGTITFGGGTSRILQPASIGVGGPGTVTVNGGDHAAYSGMILGNFNCTATGTVVVAGGRLDVTNASANAVLEVRSGTVQLNSGTLTINTLVVTNACGRFIKAGGTLSITTTNLAPNLDADGDGWSNNHEAAAGTDPFNSASMPTVTSWKTAGDGKWETDGNWSVSAPSAQFQQVLVTNATTKTVTIDAVTTNFPGTLTISNLTCLRRTT